MAKSNCIKDGGEMRQYLVERSHNPVIDPEVFDRGQRKLAERSTYRQPAYEPTLQKPRIFPVGCGAFWGQRLKLCLFSFRKVHI
ncbi:MAG: hypothetical protein HFI06_02895 [Eubacterium sp.]|nr:hypothetical protein [Eubacterium sp.]NBI87150.1 hypothetical protein [Lachnospiraceae bacterium]